MSTSTTAVQTERDLVRVVGKPAPVRTLVYFAPNRADEVTVVRVAGCPVWQVERTGWEEHASEGPSWVAWVVAGLAGAVGVAAVQDSPEVGVGALAVGGAVIAIPYALGEDSVSPLPYREARVREGVITCRSHRVAGLRVSAGSSGRAVTDGRGVARFSGPVELGALRVEGRRVDHIHVVVTGSPARPAVVPPGSPGPTPEPGVSALPPTSALPPGVAPSTSSTPARPSPGAGAPPVLAPAVGGPR